jgi:hypothetical protein
MSRGLHVDVTWATCSVKSVSSGDNVFTIIAHDSRDTTIDIILIKSR